MNEFKPGDVVVHPEYGRGIVQDSPNLWVEFASSPHWAPPLADVAADLRRLVVIDPDNEDDTDRLGDILENHEWQPKPRFGAFHSGLDLAAALREFADPKPPKPEEPTGLGAVVEDAAGTVWVRVAADDDPGNDTLRACASPPWRHRGLTAKWWAHLDAVRVLSEGVQP